MAAQEHNPVFYSAVFVLLIDEHDQVLLQRRVNTGFMDGHYDISATGHVEPDESIVTAAIRETEEETGVRVAPDNLKLIMASQMNTDRPYLNYIFVCRKWDGEPNIMEPEKCDDLAWFSKNELPKFLTPTLHLLRERNFSEEISLEYVDASRRDQLMRS